MRAWTMKEAVRAGLGALLLLGFAQADPSDDLAGPPGVTNPGGDRDSDFNNVEIVDAALKPKLELVRIGSQRGANNLLGVFAGLKNKTDHRLALEIETIYKDKGGNELNTGSWIRLTLGPNEQNDYRSSAISESAVEFLVRVRRAPGSAASAH
jgi:hypothetical protein